ncbi:hypothetical protein Drorol1_Dr00019561 [Drosera rotundifolia]
MSPLCRFPFTISITTSLPWLVSTVPMADSNSSSSSDDEPFFTDPYYEKNDEDEEFDSNVDKEGQGNLVVYKPNDVDMFDNIEGLDVDDDDTGESLLLVSVGEGARFARFAGGSSFCCWKNCFATLCFAALKQENFELYKYQKVQNI